MWMITDIMKIYKVNLGEWSKGPDHSWNNVELWNTTHVKSKQDFKLEISYQEKYNYFIEG